MHAPTIDHDFSQDPHVGVITGVRVRSTIDKEHGGGPPIGTVLDDP